MARGWVRVEKGWVARQESDHGGPGSHRGMQTHFLNKFFIMHWGLAD